MFGMIRKVMTAGALLAVSGAVSQAATVKFDQPNMGFGEGLITVESTDGKTWSKIKESKINLPMAVFIGHNNNDHRLGFVSVHQDGKMIFKDAIPYQLNHNPYTRNLSKKVSTANFNSLTRSRLLNACNSRLKAAGDINKDQQMYFKVPLMLFAKFHRDNGTWYSQTGHGHSMVQVLCKAYPKRVPPKPMVISSVKFMAYAKSSNSLGVDRCPKQRTVRVKLEGSRKGKVTVWLYRDDGKRSSHKVPVSLPGEHHQYFVLASKWVTKSETHKYYMVVEGHNITRGWKTVSIDCSTVDTGNAPDQVAIPPKWPDAKPKPQKPNRPQIIVRPVKPTKPVRPVVDLATPNLKCIGGKVKLNKCYCKRNYKKLKVAKHTYRCVKMTTSKTPKRVKPNRKRRKAVRKNQRQQTNNPVLNMFKTVQ